MTGVIFSDLSMINSLLLSITLREVLAFLMMLNIWVKKIRMRQEKPFRLAGDALPWWVEVSEFPSFEELVGGLADVHCGC